MSILPHPCFLRVTATGTGHGGAPEEPSSSGAPSSDRSRGQRKRTFTCSSLPPSEVFETVIDVPDRATLVEFHGFFADQ